MVNRANPLLTYVAGLALGFGVSASLNAGDTVTAYLNASFAVAVLGFVVYGEISDGFLADVDY
ncbi:MAG: hypothetical protein ACLFMT_02710 [Halobacteriales archaeon]